MARFGSSMAPGSYSTVVSENGRTDRRDVYLPWHTPNAATICPRRGVTSARSGPARSDTSKLSQWTTTVLIVQASFVSARRRRTLNHGVRGWRADGGAFY